MSVTTETTMRVEISGPGVYPDIPGDVYRADPAPKADGGSLSRSGAVKLVPPGVPAAFDYWRRNPRVADETSDALNFGAAAHAHVLTDGAGVHVVDAKDWRTDAAKDERAAAQARGQVVILAKHRRVVDDMATALRRHRIAGALLSPDSGTPEASIFWRNPRTDRWQRCRPDILRRTGIGRRYVIPDYKTARDASRDAFGKAAFDNGLYMQAPWYCDGVRAVGIDPNPLFLFVVQEKTPPYLVNVIELDGDAMDLGRRHNAIAAAIFDRCLTAGDWPGYGDAVDVASLPPWALKREGI